jgi:hypothetical protein
MGQSKFQPGDRVRFQIGSRLAHGVVKGDGPIEIDGDRLYVIEIRGDEELPSQLELPARKLAALAPLPAHPSGLKDIDASELDYEHDGTYTYKAGPLPELQWNLTARVSSSVKKHTGTDN